MIKNYTDSCDRSAKYMTWAFRSFSRIFTLIELLVIVGIISILMSILLPALKKAKDKTYQSVCQNNLKQIGVDFHMYAADYDGYFPQGYDGDELWGVRIQPYFDVPQYGKSSILVCPTQEAFAKYYGDYDDDIWSNYVYNEYMNDTVSHIYRLGKGPVGYNSTGTPSTKIIMADGSEDRPKRTFQNSGGIKYLGWPHNGGTNFLFVDGHVKWRVMFPGWTPDFVGVLPLPKGYDIN